MLTVEMGELSLQGLFLIQEGDDDVQTVEYPQGEGHEFRGVRVLRVDPVEELGGFWGELEETKNKKKQMLFSGIFCLIGFLCC